jgi:hypothetical protein
MKIMVRVPGLKCDGCGKTWIPRKSKHGPGARRCPRCGKAVAP